MALDPAMLAQLRGGGSPMPTGLSRAAGPLPAGPSNTGGAAAPGAQLGNVSGAIARVRSALQLLEEALPMIPSGHEMHVKVLQQAKDLAKALQDVGADPAIQIQSMLQAIRSQVRSAPTQAMARIFPPGAETQAPPAGPVVGNEAEPPEAMAA